MKTYVKVFVKYNDIYDITVKESTREFEVTIEKDNDHRCEMYVPMDRIWGTSTSEVLFIKFRD